MHYGRYGSGGEDPRLFPLFLGYPSLVRGYDTGSFSVQECGINANNSCPVYDQLLGSRLLVGNVEVRAPLLGLLGAKNLYGPIPIEIGAFFDAGVAWDSNTKPEIFGGDRKLVRSVGGTARLNLFGFAVLQLDYAKPLDRPGKNAVLPVQFARGVLGGKGGIAGRSVRLSSTNARGLPPPRAPGRANTVMIGRRVPSYQHLVVRVCVGSRSAGSPDAARSAGFLWAALATEAGLATSS